MLFFSLFFFIGSIYVTRIPFSLLCKKEGYDNRQITENVTHISIIRAHFIKRDLIKRLKDINIVDQEKIREIFASHLLDELNPNIIRGPNHMKGLRW
jgi:3-methyladenine DNA glycosylase AlkC